MRFLIVCLLACVPVSAMASTILWDASPDATVTAYLVTVNGATLATTTGLSVPWTPGPGMYRVCVSSLAGDVTGPAACIDHDEPQQNISPSVSLSEPVSGTMYVSPASIVVGATASDPDGTITRVEFFNGSTLIGTDTATPYAITWLQGTAGTYTLTAGAIDNAGARSTSAPSLVTVTAPPVSSTGCVTNGVTYSVGTRATFQVRVRDVPTWLAARQAEGWVFIQSVPQNRNQWRVTIECRPS